MKLATLNLGIKTLFHLVMKVLFYADEFFFSHSRKLIFSGGLTFIHTVKHVVHRFNLMFRTVEYTLFIVSSLSFNIQKEFFQRENLTVCSSKKYCVDE